MNDSSPDPLIHQHGIGQALTHADPGAFSPGSVAAGGRPKGIWQVEA